MLCSTYNNTTEASCSLSNNYTKVQSAAYQYIEYTYENSGICPHYMLLKGPDGVYGVHYTTGKVYKTTNFTDWTYVSTIGSGNASFGLSFDGTYFIYAPNSGSQTTRSLDCINWTNAGSFPMSGYWTSPVSINTGCTINLTWTDTSNIYYTSDSGLSWNALPVSTFGVTSHAQISISGTDSKFIVLKSGGGAYTSTNGSSWQNPTLGYIGNFAYSRVFHRNNYVVLSTDATLEQLVSWDGGNTFSAVFSNTTLYNGGRFSIVLPSGRVVTWSQQWYDSNRVSTFITTTPIRTDIPSGGSQYVNYIPYAAISSMPVGFGDWYPKIVNWGDYMLFTAGSPGMTALKIEYDNLVHLKSGIVMESA